MRDLADLTVREFIDQAASDAPTPGGGSVAALAGALGAAMASMAAGFTVGKPKFAKHDRFMHGALAELASLSGSLLKAVSADAEAFSGIAGAYKEPKDADGGNRRRLAVREALFASMRIPAGVLADCRRAAELLPSLAEAANPNLLSDVEVAAVMLAAAARAARANVLANSRRLMGEDSARSAEDDARDCVEAVEKETGKAIEIAAARQAQNI